MSDKDEETLFYLDNYGGNSSLIDFGSKENIKVKTKRLDSFDFGNSIKLLKIDAEGLEPEVLKGSIGIINKIKYISVDFGAERGEKQGLTVVDVNDFLYSNNFSLVSFSEHRLIGLYLNNGQRWDVCMNDIWYRELDENIKLFFENISDEKTQYKYLPSIGELPEMAVN